MFCIWWDDNTKINVTEMGSWDSVICIVTGKGAGWLKNCEAEAFLFSKTPRPVLEHTQPTIPWLSSALFPRVKCPRHDANHTRLSSAATHPLPSYALDSFDARQEQVEGSCDHGNEPLDPIKDDDFHG